MNDFVVVHRPHHRAFEVSEPLWVVWKTCMRQIALGLDSFGLPEDLQGDDQVLRGEDAYKFCLEVICGLHSPVIAETEVQGQFKDHFENFMYPLTPWGQELQKTVRHLLQDSKLVRKNLKNLGSQTYGSAVRRRLKKFKSVSIIGGGQLSQSIVPWLIKEHEVRVHTRRLEQANKIADLFPSIRPGSWKRGEILDLGRAVVIAAPITSQEFSALSQNSSYEIAIDLRETSQVDPLLADKGAVIPLVDFFEEISQNQTGIKERVSEAFALTKKLAQLRAEACVVRPYGWEDLCV